MSSIACRADTRASLVVNEEDGCYRELNFNPPPQKQSAAAGDASLTTHHNQAQDTNAVVAASAAAAGVRRLKRGRQCEESQTKNDTKRIRATSKCHDSAASSADSSNANVAGTETVEDEVRVCLLHCVLVESAYTFR